MELTARQGATVQHGGGLPVCLYSAVQGVEGVSIWSCDVQPLHWRGPWGMWLLATLQLDSLLIHSKAIHTIPGHCIDTHVIHQRIKSIRPLHFYVAV